MNVNHLRYFVRLAALQNYTQAAKSLHITQPTLTSAIHTLEKELNTQFFYKTGRNVKLTLNGELFAQKVTQSLTILDAGIASLYPNNTHQDQITLVTIPALNAVWLPKMISEFKNTSAGKNVAFSFISDTTLSLNLLNNLRDNQYDICFASKINGYPDINFTPIAQEELVVITPLGHPLSTATSLTIEDLLPYDQVSYSKRSGLAPIIASLYQEYGWQPKSKYQVDDDLAVAGLVANNLGVAIVPKRLALAIQKLCIVPLVTNGPRRLIYLCTSKRHTLNTAANAFIQFISEKEIAILQ
ncbi:LysR family transcriptional regulator [Periweissella beninensis]|uniref:LysR family transcriptional regulator n=1 Tax=Periweissella beninensis TaxID=504936 RepID=UPI0021A65740|nr:LysR family transcriptional regulator [Periweissella beninensis]MCT4396545.1 LysR family transcriptional regulator [Periweissella beninensis]